MLLFFFLSCSSKQQSVEEYLRELSSEVVSCTTEAEYESVYEKIIACKNDERFKGNNDISYNENVEIVKRMAALIHEALVVKAILYVMPSSITPTSQDMRNLVNVCVNNNINIQAFPYSDVRDIVYDYYKLSE